MEAFLGHMLDMGMPRDWSKAQRIKFGRELLVKITGRDFGYDPIQWHHYLWEVDAGGYRWSRSSENKWARYAEAALDDPEWREAVKELQE